MSLEHVLMIFISFHNAKIYLKFLDFPKLCGRPRKDLSQIFQDIETYMARLKRKGK